MLEILLITLISFFLGGLWFSPKLFGNIWMRGIDREIIKNHQDSKNKLLFLLLINITISFIKTLCAWYIFKNVNDLFQYGIFCFIFIFLISSVHIQNLYFAKRSLYAVGVEWSYQALDSVIIFALITLLAR